MHQLTKDQSNLISGVLKLGEDKSKVERDIAESMMMNSKLSVLRAVMEVFPPDSEKYRMATVQLAELMDAFALPSSNSSLVPPLSSDFVVSTASTPPTPVKPTPPTPVKLTTNANPAPARPAPPNLPNPPLPSAWPRLRWQSL